VRTSDQKTASPPVPARQRWAGLRLLRGQPDYRRIYFSQLVSLGGDWFAMIPLLTLLLQLTRGSLWGALVLAADTLMIALLSPYAGVIADRVDRRRLMIACDVASAGFIALLLLVRGESTAWIAVLALGGVASLKAFYGPAVNAAIPNLVPESDVLTATALSGAVWGVMLAVGASLGAIVTAAAGPRSCFLIDAATFLLSAVLTGRVRGSCGPESVRAHRGSGNRASFKADALEVLRLGRAQPRLITLISCKPGTGLGNGVLAMFPAMGAEVFRVGSVGVGALYAARGVGALIGPLAGRRLVAGNQVSIRTCIALAMFLFGVAYIGFTAAPWFPLAVALVVVAHIGGSMNAGLSTYALQRAAPDHIRGRVLSIDLMFYTLSLGASQLIAAGLNSFLSPAATVLCMGAVVVGYAAAWSMCSGRVRLRFGGAVRLVVEHPADAS
jgi:MFS family permease